MRGRTKMKHCKNCGGEVSETAKFCNHCGHNLTNENEGEATETDDLQAEEEEGQENKKESVEDDTEKKEEEMLNKEEYEKKEQEEKTEIKEREKREEKTEIEETEEAEETTTPTLENETPETDKQGNSALSKLKKKPNLLIFGSVALVVLLVGILVISMGKPSEKKAIERFEAAI